MSNIHDVIHTLIDVVSGSQAHLSSHEAATLHDAVTADQDAATALDGPDVAPEPAPAEAPYPPPYPPAPADVFTPAPAEAPRSPGAVTNSGEPVAG